jgi:hypothetical protein
MPSLEQPERLAASILHDLCELPQGQQAPHYGAIGL